MTFARLFVGALLIVFSLSGLAVSALSLVDPVGSKMADDGDPFGKPPSSQRSWLLAGASTGVLVLGSWLVLRRQRPKE